MRNPRITPLRFFRVLPLHSPFLVMGVAAAAAIGVVTLAWDPRSGPSVLAPILMLQMFAAASGFDVPARRGHFDLLLTGGTSRMGVVIGHFMVSAAPGVVAWCALGLCELVLHGTDVPAAFTSGSLIALLIVSMLAWALTVPLPRLSGGVIWLLLVVVAFAPLTDFRAAMVEALKGGGSSAMRALGALLFPFVLLGTSVDASSLATVLPAVGAATVAWGAAARWMVREDVPLETAQ